MTKRIVAILAVAALGIGGSALAGGENKPHKKHTGQTAPGQTDTTGQTEGMGQTGQMGMTGGAENKHIALVDIYLDMASDNAQLLEFLAGMELEKKDRAIVTEVQKNLTLALDGAIKHVGQIKTTDATQNKELVSNLKDARTAAKKLRSAKIDQLSTSVADVSTAIQSAETSFDTLAQSVGYTEIEDSQRQPVRGGTPDETDLEPFDPSKSMDKEETPPPGTETPDTLPEPAQPTAPPSETRPGGY